MNGCRTLYEKRCNEGALPEKKSNETERNQDDYDNYI